MGEYQITVDFSDIPLRTTLTFTSKTKIGADPIKTTCNLGSYTQTHPVSKIAIERHYAVVTVTQGDDKKITNAKV